MRGLLPGGVANLNAIDDGHRARRPGHAGSRSFVLDDVGLAFPISDSALYLDREAVCADLRFGQFGADRLLDGGVGQAPGR